MRRLRAEHDVVTNSIRMGQRNREPRARIIETKMQISQFTDLPVDDINTAIKFLQKIRILKRDSRTGEGPDAVYYTVKKHRDLLDFLIM